MEIAPLMVGNIINESSEIVKCKPGDEKIRYVGIWKKVFLVKEIAYASTQREKLSWCLRNDCDWSKIIWGQESCLRDSGEW